MQGYFPLWIAFVVFVMLGSLVWNLTHPRNRGAVRPAARGAPVAAPASRPVACRAAQPTAYVAPAAAPVAVAPVVVPGAVPQRQARARGPKGPPLGAQYRQQLIAAGRIIPADPQMPAPVPAPDPALDFTL